MKATNQSQMNSVIKKNSGTAKALVSIPNPILEPNAGGVLYDQAIVNRTIKTKLSGIISKK